MKGKIFILMLLVVSILLMCCSKLQTAYESVIYGNSQIKIEPYLEDGTETWMLAGAGGVRKGKYLRFKLTNNNSEDYLVQFTLTTKGKALDSGSNNPRDFVFQIPNIIAPAYAKTQNIFTCMLYDRNGYWTTDKGQFYGINSDGSCLAESVDISNIKIVKASDRPERIKLYKLSDGRLAYDTQGAIPYGGSYSQKILD